MERYLKATKLMGLAIGVTLAVLLAACGDAPRPTARPVVPTPTAAATPASYDNIPAAVDVNPSPRPAVRTTIVAGTSAEMPELSGGTALPGITYPANPDEIEVGASRPFERVFIDADPTALAKLFGTPGPDFRFGALPGAGARITPPPGGGNPNAPAPTPTLNTSPGAVRVESLKNTAVSFVTAYKQASLKLLEVSRSARLVFASANLLKPERTVWSFFFVLPEGGRGWRVIYDSDGNRADVREVPPSNVADASLIDITLIQDSPALVDKAASAGLKISLPVDIISFQIEGLSKQPCFMFTNTAQGKQVAVHAYTGQVIRNDFA